MGTAATEWVFLDTLSGRPARIPPEMIATFFPEGAPEETTQPEPIPSVEPPASGVFRVQPRVGWRDIDSALHMNNTSYFDYLSDCSIQALAAGRWSYQRFLSEGFTVQPLQMQIKYQQPALAGDVLDVLTWNSGLEQERLKQHYQINRSADGVLLAHATTRSACVSLVSGLPVPFFSGSGFGSELNKKWLAKIVSPAIFYDFVICLSQTGCFPVRKVEWQSRSPHQPTPGLPPPKQLRSAY